MQYLDFSVGNSRYGIEISSIVEVMTNLNITPIPESSEFVNGYSFVRGKVTPIYNLSKHLGLSPLQSRYCQYIVVEYNNNSIALEISSANKIHSIPDASIKKCPMSFLPTEPLVKYMVQDDSNTLLPILDITRLFNEDSLSVLEQIAS